MPSLFIVDDSPSIRRLTRSQLEHDWYLVSGEAEDGVQPIDSATQLKPDMMLLDASLPRLGGPQGASILKRALSKTRTILFTRFDDAIRNMPAVGADLVISKNRAHGENVRSWANGTETNRQPLIRSQLLKRRVGRQKIEISRTCHSSVFSKLVSIPAILKTIGK